MAWLLKNMAWLLLDPLSDKILRFLLGRYPIASILFGYSLNYKNWDCVPLRVCFLWGEGGGGANVIELTNYSNE